MKISSKLRDIAAVAADEFRTVSTSYSVLLVLMGGIFLYGLLYNYMYEPNLIRDAPVAVVDRSHSPLSREYARLLDAAPQVRVLTDEAGFPEAKELMKRGDAVGIVYIPEDFETRVGRGEESLFVMYGTTEAFLYYLAMQEAVGRDARTRRSLSPADARFPAPRGRAADHADPGRHGRRHRAVQSYRGLRQLPDPGRSDGHHLSDAADGFYCHLPEILYYNNISVCILSRHRKNNAQEEDSKHF